MNDPLIDSLNDQQRQAVTAPPGHLMILAGAGSGKTRVLVHRIAWLFQNYGISPDRILAVTFTNKAAKEMRSRVESLLGMTTGGMWIGTFHGLAHRLLRLHYSLAGLNEDFQILDSEDQYRLIKRILKNLNLDEQHWPARKMQNYINSQKDKGLRAQMLTSDGDYHEKTRISIYSNYQQACDQNHMVDFTELLLRSFELLNNNSDLLDHYRHQFKQILVDEFQDTNTLQYRWLKLFSDNNENHLTVVGDDDQSIYAWRGAKIENIQKFKHDFAQVQTIRLEQNYRSTQTILQAANAVIGHNKQRLGKSLWTKGDTGQPIRIYSAFNELDEARFIADRIKQHFGRYQYQDMAILYRSNAQSRVIEEALLQSSIPYRVYGGMRFFERAEIKNALAYCRAVISPDNDPAIERIINTPSRGIGDRTMEILRQTARQERTSLWQATQLVLTTGVVSGRARSCLQQFADLIRQLQKETSDQQLGEQINHIIKHSGLVEHYKKEPGEKAQSRLENLDELSTAAEQYIPESHEVLPMTAFLAHAALEAGEGQSDQHDDCVQLMTMHSAKGLEFPIVFLSGAEEELFPPRQSLEDPKRLEEERRLCYVAITRAMEQLIITHAESRRLYGQIKQHLASRFLRELPKECTEQVRMKMNITRPQSFAKASGHTPKFTTSAPGAQVGNAKYQVGQMVRHPSFGEGIILNYEGQGEKVRLQINFQSAGTKWIAAAIAPLETI